MNRNLLSLACILVFLPPLVSCSGNADFIMSDYVKLRDEIDVESAKIKWSQAIMPDGLAEKKALAPVAKLPDTLTVYRVGSDIYPSLPGFGSLDTSVLPNEVLDLLDGFFASAATPPPDARIVETDFLSPKYDFLPSVLKHHFASLPPVSRIIYGKPFVIDDGYQIPVRFDGELAYADANVFVSPQGLSYAIDQIQFGTPVGDVEAAMEALLNAGKTEEGSEEDAGGEEQSSDGAEQQSVNAEEQTKPENQNVSNQS